MNDERYRFLLAVKAYVASDPEAAPLVAQAASDGVSEALREALQRGADMETALAVAVAKRYKGATSPQQTAPVTEAKSLSVPETGWLIENGKSGSELRYRTWNELGAGPEWTDDHMKATRYCRRIDAELAASGDEDAGAIVEHSWSNA